MIPQVLTLDLHKPDMLHTIALGLFMHMMDWIQGILKKNARRPEFDKDWKYLPPYSGFFVIQKAYCEVALSQGLQMRNLGHCQLGVLAVALRGPNSTQVQLCRSALTCVRSLLAFTMMTQYRSHTPKTSDYTEEYPTRFHETKDIILQFRELKRTQAKADELC